MEHHQLKNFKKTITLFLFTLAGNPTVAKAVQLFDDPAGEPPTKAKEVTVFVGHIKDIVVSVAGVLAVAMIIWGAFYLVTSNGNEDRLTKGKTILRTAILGFILIITANVLVNIFIQMLGGSVQ